MQLTQKELEKAKHLRGKGTTYAEIARRLGYTRQEVWYGLVVRKGVARIGRVGRKAGWDTQKALEMFEKGSSYGDIAKTLGQKYDTVRIWLRNEQIRQKQES